MLSEEEKKKYISDFLNDIIKSQDDRIILVWEAEEILNLLEKQQAEIEKLTKQRNDLAFDISDKEDELQELKADKEEIYYKGYIQKQNEAMEICKECIKKHKAELEKKNKIINEMAYDYARHNPCIKGSVCAEDKDCTECVIEYYTNKVEGEK